MTEQQKATTADEPFDFAKAIERVFTLGQNYWADADSESYARNRNSVVTLEKFRVLKAGIMERLRATPQPADVSQARPAQEDAAVAGGTNWREVASSLNAALLSNDASHAEQARRIYIRAFIGEYPLYTAPPPIVRSDAAPVAQEVSNAIRARDRLYCEAIIATLDSSGPRLVNDTERMLHHFNTHRPDQTDALALATKPAGASGVADMQAIRDRLECALAQYFHLCAAGEKGRLKARLHAAREIDAMLDALAASSDTPAQGT